MFSAKDQCLYCDERDQEKLFNCPHCKEVAACSEAHLKPHRGGGPTKGKCFPFVIRRSRERGLHMIAARNIKAICHSNMNTISGERDATVKYDFNNVQPKIILLMKASCTKISFSE